MADRYELKKSVKEELNATNEDGMYSHGYSTDQERSLVLPQDYKNQSSVCGNESVFSQGFLVDLSTATNKKMTITETDLFLAKAITT